jgi:ribosomal protein L11 methyltransferase
MPWLELRISADRAQASFIEDLLFDLGAESVTLTDAASEPLFEPLPGAAPLWHRLTLSALFDQGTDMGGVRSALIGIGKIEAQALAEPSLIEDQAWERVWMKDFAKARFGKRLWIVPTHENPPDDGDAVCLMLDPGLAFGSGSHPSTALCLEYLDAHPPAGLTVLDYGCGSGVLSLAALKLGARKVYAVDHDPQALLATGENFKRNFTEGGALVTTCPDDPALPLIDLILANILSSTLIELAPRLRSLVLRSLVNRGGQIVLSGILIEQLAGVAAAYETPAFARQTRDGWALLCSNP